MDRSRNLVRQCFNSSKRIWQATVGISVDIVFRGYPLLYLEELKYRINFCEKLITLSENFLNPVIVLKFVTLYHILDFINVPDFLVKRKYQIFSIYMVKFRNANVRASRNFSRGFLPTFLPSTPF